MAKWEELIAARESKHLSQAEMAECMKVGHGTYQRWEAGKSKPQPHHRRRLAEIFGEAFEQEEETFLPIEPEQDAAQTSVPAVSAVASLNEARTFIATNMITHLWSLAFLRSATCEEKRSIVQQTIKEFDSMNTNNTRYQFTRREALSSLAALPMITLGLTSPGAIVPATRYKSALEHCSASLEACWELRKSDNPNDRSLALQCSSRYLSTLKNIAQNSTTYRKEALDLATRYAVIKAYLARHLIGLVEAIQYGKEAVVLSKETEDFSLQFITSQSLAWSYFYAKKYPLALSTSLEAEAGFLQYSRLSQRQPLHPSMQASLYSTLGLMQVKNGLPVDLSLGKAAELDPGDDGGPFIDFKRSTLLLDVGLIRCYQGDQAKAVEAFEQRVDPETLQPKMIQSEIGRVETLNALTLSSLRSKDRDMERTIHFWQGSLEGTKALRSEQRLNEVLANYELMETIWPNEPRIIELRERIEHWE